MMKSLAKGIKKIFTEIVVSEVQTRIILPFCKLKEGWSNLERSQGNNQIEVSTATAVIASTTMQKEESKKETNR